VNPRTRKAALYAIAVIAMLASANALAHSYAGLYDWAAHHRLTGWQAMSWPAEIDVFLAVGELALYVAYLDGWPTRQRIWPWATTLVGLSVSVAGNVGHIQPLPGQPVLLVDRLTAAASPLAAFAGLTVGLLVLRMNRHHAATGPTPSAISHLHPIQVTPEHSNGHHSTSVPWVPGPVNGVNQDQPRQASPGAPACARPGVGSAAIDASPLLEDAASIYRTAVAHGEQLSQRALARTLRGRGHRFPNQSLHSIARTIGLVTVAAHVPAADG
jgi:hypothetical protein